jgi:hypothetical protein
MNDKQRPQNDTSPGEERAGATKWESPSQVGVDAVQCPPVHRGGDDVGAFALAFPSVSCEDSRNLRINPDHPRIGRLELVEVQASAPDPRLDFPR